MNLFIGCCVFYGLDGSNTGSGCCGGCQVMVAILVAVVAVVRGVPVEAVMMVTVEVALVVVYHWSCRCMEFL